MLMRSILGKMVRKGFFLDRDLSKYGVRFAKLLERGEISAKALRQ